MHTLGRAKIKDARKTGKSSRNGIVGNLEKFSDLLNRQKLNGGRLGLHS